MLEAVTLRRGVRAELTKLGKKVALYSFFFQTPKNMMFYSLLAIWFLNQKLELLDAALYMMTIKIVDLFSHHKDDSQGCVNTVTLSMTAYSVSLEQASIHIYYDVRRFTMSPASVKMPDAG